MSAPSFVYIGMGSNLNHPLQQVSDGLAALKQNPKIQLLRRSPWYGSKAIGPGEQADYVNGVIELETTLSPHQLLVYLQTIETQQGRVRELRWGARTLDLDILLYGNICVEATDLQIPHPRLSERSFVLVPLAALNPDLHLPSLKSAPQAAKNATISALLSQLPTDNVWLLTGEHDVVPL